MTQNADSGARCLTVGDLRGILDFLPAEMPVVIHAGWDFPLADWKLDQTDNKVVLYADYEDQATVVNKDWFETWRHLPPYSEKP